MTEPLRASSDFSDLEARIRAAGRYVRASDDLRPAVVEAARVDRWAHQGAVSFAAVAVAVVIATYLASGVSRKAEAHRQEQVESIEAADVWQLDETVRREVRMPVGGSGWAMVEILNSVRDRQAALLSADAAADKPSNERP